MSKWKKNGKRILVILLAAAIIGGMTEHLRFTAVAEGQENESEACLEGDEVSGGNSSSDEADALDADKSLDAEETKTSETDGSTDAEEAGTLETDGSPDTEGTGTPEADGSLDAEGTETSGSEDNLNKDGEEVIGNAPEEEGTSDPESNKETEEDPAVSGDPEVTEQPEDSENIQADEESRKDILGMEQTDGTKADGIIDASGARKDPAVEEGEAVLSENGLLMNTDLDAETEKEQDPEVAAVEELIKALPSLDELRELNQEELFAAYEQIQAAYDAYEGLEDEQKALLLEAEELLRELLEYFTELVMPAATDEQVEAAWNAMTTAMENWEATVDLSSYQIKSEDWGRIWPDVAQNNPDLFYMLMATHYPNTQGVIQRVDFTYNPNYDKNDVSEYKNAVQKVFNEVIRNNGSMTDEQKALALHDYLVQHMVYDQNANNNLGIEKRNAYEALVNGIGVCEGYTLAYAALLKEAGIEVDYCRSTSMNHIWNYVKLNGNWYHADLTYDDATASSQVGATGYVKHGNFLLSDDAMRNTSPGHAWEPNGITCSDTTYNNSWHKTEPLNESAIYTVGGNYYYLRGDTVAGAPNTIYRGAILIRRDASGNETEAGSFEIENLGNGWPMYSMCFSRLSCSNGILYFNVGNSVYSYRPSVNTAPVKIYEYQDATNRIVTGLVATGDKITLEIYNPQTYKIEDKIDMPLFVLNASTTEVKAGYTTAPILSVNPLATGFTWSKQLPDGSWETISGANGSSYTMEIGLPVGSYRYRVEATLDGKAVSSEIIVIVANQEEQKNFAFSQGNRTVTYGDTDFTVTAQGAETGAVVRYSSSDPSVASVDPGTGSVRILKAGSAVITATASETEDYLEAKSTYTLTVLPKALSWDVSALEAKDRLDRIKGQAATLYGELRLTGILEKDAGTVRFECQSDRLSGSYKTVAAGSQKVTLSWKSAQDMAVLQGEGSGNYTMPAALPEIMGRISVADDSLPVLPESDDKTSFRIQVEYGISEVPASFQNKEHLNTPGRIEKEMKLKIQEKSGEIGESNIVTYDVDLFVNINETGWQKATADSFPSNGLTITLPYPSGTGKDTHDFVVAHMFTTDMNGFHVGDVEYPAVTKTDAGLTFKVCGLSPVSIGWKEAQKNSGSSGGSGSSSGNGSNSGSGSAAPTSVVSNVNSASTGDALPVMQYMLLAAAASILLVFFVIKRRIRG